MGSRQGTKATKRTGGSAAVVACPACGTKNRVPTSSTGRPRCASCHADLPWLVHADDTTYTSAVLQSPLPVLVDAWAPWCGPCGSIAPLLETVAKDYAGRLKVVKVNVDVAQGTSRRLGVQGIPALFLARDGKVRELAVGALPLPELRRRLDAALG